ncbi:hypothetical protein [Cohnella nanjingensis]|uniref:Uncharacterized protein n=1 Tax=Cohnella nanjingensis TaxID=1387779 RepID=A0A7X0RWW0_9BACL|nr:hypothetical protein [Cohnella nanjingensis]MBB6675168.1 hypothetical protein [Cohnella nanjingensis]
MFDRIGGHTRRVKGAEDYEFIPKSMNAERCNVENLPDVLYAYRRSPFQRSLKYFGRGRTHPVEE